MASFLEETPLINFQKYNEISKLYDASAFVR